MDFIHGNIPLFGKHRAFLPSEYLYDFLKKTITLLSAKKKKWVIAFDEIKSLQEFCELETTEPFFVFPPPDVLPFEQVEWSVSTSRKRLSTLNLLGNSENEGYGVVTTIPTLFHKTIDPGMICSGTLKYRMGDPIINQSGKPYRREDLAKHLSEAGYQRVYNVENPCEFSIRGFIFDYFGLLEKYPIRIEFMDDEVSDIRFFDPETQKSFREDKDSGIDNIKTNERYNTIPPCRETFYNEEAIELLGSRIDVLIKKYPNSIFLENFREKYMKYASLGGVLLPNNPAFIHFFSDDTLFFYIDVDNALERFRSYERDLFELYPQGEYKEIYFKYLRVSESVLMARKHLTLIETKNHKIASAEPSDQLISDYTISPEGLNTVQKKGPSKAFLEFPNQVLSSSEDLVNEDLIVHEDFGIGRYLGNEIISNYSGTREYMKLEYEDQVRIFVPVENLDRVHKYIGDESLVRLTRLKSSSWAKTRNKVKEDIEERVEELVQLYAIRKSIAKTPINGDNDLEERFALSFPYIETKPQSRTIEEVYGDLGREYPMDRLVFGDAGSGKTEIAMRAAFRMVLNGKQTAMLVPTTILSKQHFETFSERFSQFGVKTVLLNRFTTDKERKMIYTMVSEGTADIVIGTHSLLSNRLKYKNLGLLVIDEEQKFGVSQKEKIKRMKTQVDVLTLSATPIPRTLYMGFSGVKEMSVVDVLPPGRIPVEVLVSGWEERIVKTGILRELSRGGQVIYVHNRVESIGDSLEKVMLLVPEAKIGLAHGQMKKSLFEKTIQDFYDGLIDVLICTTIIESGVDIPNANTLIIDDAHRYGLSQLYQLRGRVGRSDRRAYAYFLFPKRTRLLPETRSRLEAIQTFSGAGSGLQLALKDMEIRGIGNLLGFEQHGNINTIGLHLYQQILDDVLIKRGIKTQVSENEKSEELIQVEILGFTMNCVLTEYYIGNQLDRMKIYRKIAVSRTLSDINAIEDEMEDRFGPIDENTKSLLLYSRIRILAFSLGITRIEALKRSQNVKIIFSDRRHIDNFSLFNYRGFSDREALQSILYEMTLTDIGALLLRNFGDSESVVGNNF
jgi:transcription-repair coupling factor (superfamily II helicase)